MKILLINSEHGLLGGAHTVYFNIAEMLRERGHDVIFFAMHSNNELPCPQADFFSKKSNKNNKLLYLCNAFYNKNAGRKLEKLIEKEHPEIAHIHLMWRSLSPSILDVLKRNHVPVVHTVHDYSMICSHVTLRSTNGGYVCEKCAGGHYLQSIKTRCYNGSIVKSFLTAVEMYSRNRFHHPANLIDHFNFVSNFCAEKHKEMDNKFQNVHCSVIYNVPDSKVVAISEKGIANTYNSYYLYYGRLAYEKGLNTLVSAFIALPNLRLKIVGTGPMEQPLKEKCSDKINNIEFLGFKKGEELYELVRNARYVCVPSEWYENCPMTVIEGFTLGTPVIGARIGGIPELVNDSKNGFLFESGKLNSLIDTIKKSNAISEEEYKSMKKNAFLMAHVRFNREKYIDQILEIYKQTIQEK